MFKATEMMHINSAKWITIYWRSVAWSKLIEFLQINLINHVSHVAGRLVAVVTANRFSQFSAAFDVF